MLDLLLEALPDLIVEAAVNVAVSAFEALGTGGTLLRDVEPLVSIPPADFRRGSGRAPRTGAPNPHARTER